MRSVVSLSAGACLVRCSRLAVRSRRLRGVIAIVLLRSAGVSYSAGEWIVTQAFSVISSTLSHIGIWCYSAVVVLLVTVLIIIASWCRRWCGLGCGSVVSLACAVGLAVRCGAGEWVVAQALSVVRGTCSHVSIWCYTACIVRCVAIRAAGWGCISHAR